MVMAGLTIVVLVYVRTARPGQHPGGPFWEALWANAMWPGGIGLALAAAGLIEPGRRRTASLIAIVVIVLAYALLSPPLNFA